MRGTMSLGAASAILIALAAVYVLFVAFAVWKGGSHGVIVALVAAPVFGLLAVPSLLAFFPAYWGWLRERAWGPWQGRYYAFDGRQVRVAEARGRLWFSSADVHAALALTRRAGVLAGFDATERMTHDELGDALSNAGLTRLLARSTAPRTLRFLRWAERDVLLPWQNKRHRDAVVSDPSHRAPR